MTSLNEKLAKRRQEIKNRGAGGSVNFIKEGTIRIRVRPAGDEVDWAVEVKSFYLGGDIKGVFSRESVGEDCPIMSKYNELKNSNKSGDKDIAKKLSPRIKYLISAVVYEDGRGETIDEVASKRLTQLPTGIYNQMIDYFLDPDMGDFTDPEEGYDLKIKRVGKGIKDTEYTLIPVKKSTRVPKAFREEVDPQDIFTEDVLLSYEDCEDKLAMFLVESTEDEPEEKAPRRRKKKKK